MPVITPGFPYSDYHVEQLLSEKEIEIAEELVAVINRTERLSDFCQKYGENQTALSSFMNSIDYTKLNVPLAKKEKLAFETQLANSLKSPGKEKIAKAIADRIHGYVLIQPLFEDDDLEEITVNGSDPVFVYHRTQNVCKTNLALNKNQLDVLVSQMELDRKKAIHDFRLVDWHRANAILPPLVQLPAITVRKFRTYPYSIIELIEKKTFSSEVAAFLWAAIDGLQSNPLNFLIIGGTSAGKTTTLNSLSAFIPPSERIVTIEDTPELNLYQRQNWVQTISTDDYSMQDVLKNALRMRPDRIIVGDIRGEEAETLFTAMNTGHRGVMGTLHANNAKDMAKRLENEPMNVPQSLIPLASFVIVQHRINDRKLGVIRRITQVSEITKIEEGVIAMNDLFLYDVGADALKKTGFQSLVVEILAEYSRKSINEVKEEIEHRKEILDLLVEKKVLRFEDVVTFLWKFYEQYSEMGREPAGLEKRRK